MKFEVKEIKELKNSNQVCAWCDEKNIVISVEYKDGGRESYCEDCATDDYNFCPECEKWFSAYEEGIFATDYFNDYHNKIDPLLCRECDEKYDNYYNKDYDQLYEEFDDSLEAGIDYPL